MNNKYLQEDKWWVSPYNFVDEVTSEFESAGEGGNS